jgi:hypothetical protein
MATLGGSRGCILKGLLDGRISAISSPVRRDRLVEKQITGGKSGRHYSISFWPSI